MRQATRLYLRFTLSFRNVEDLMAERGVTVSYETIRRWVAHFGPLRDVVLRDLGPSHIQRRGKRLNNGVESVYVPIRRAALPFCVLSST